MSSAPIGSASRNRSSSAGRNSPYGCRAASRPVGRRRPSTIDPERLAPAAPGSRSRRTSRSSRLARIADPLGGDEPAAGGAVDAVRERVRCVARIHRPTVYCLGRRRAPPRRSGLARRYPQGVSCARRGGSSATTRHDKEAAVPQADGRAATDPAPDHFRHCYSKDKAGLDPPPVPDGGPGPRHRPDDRARGVLRRHPPADRRPAGRRRRAVRSSSSRTTSRAASGRPPSGARPTSTSTR